MDPHSTTILDACAGLLRGAQLTALQLAEHMGEQIPAAAPDAAPAAPTAARRSEALALAARPSGASVHEVAEAMGVRYATAYTHLRRLLDAGEIVCEVLRGGAGMTLARWFVDPQAAAAWKAEQIAARAAAAKAKAEAKPRKQGRPGVELLAAPRGTSLGLSAPAPGPAAHAVIPAGVKRTVCAAPPGRFDVAADQPLTGGFSTTRPGINPMTGKAWGA